MPFYEYTAMDTSGNEVTDILEAVTAEAAQSELRQQGLFVTRIQERASGFTPGGRKLPPGMAPPPTRRMTPVQKSNTPVLVVGTATACLIGALIWGASEFLGNAPHEATSSGSAAASPSDAPTPPVPRQPDPPVPPQPDPPENKGGKSDTPGEQVVVPPAEPTTASGIGPDAKVPPSEPLGSSRFAVVIGVGQYQDPEFRPLPSPEKDARDLYNLLTDPEVGGVPQEHAKLLLGADATRTNILAAIDQLKRDPVSKQSTVFIYFSGHGYTDANDGYWIPHDAKRDALKPTSVSDKELKDYLGNIPADRMVVIIDACNAAATVQGAKLKGFGNVLEKFTGSGHATLVASQEGESALDTFSELDNSLYTHFLLRGLKGEADANVDGVVTLHEVSSFLEDRVPEAARKRDGRQTPGQDNSRVSLASRFLLTIEPKRRAELARKEAEQKQLLETRLARIREMVIEGKLSEDQGVEGQMYLKLPPEKLRDVDKRVIEEYVNVLEGRLPPDRLAEVLRLAKGK